jgi:ATP-dependent Lhr-like helicase
MSEKATMETTLEDPLAPFSEPVRKWFTASFKGATPAQALGWESISSGADTLICAPTGSGKTLASFLWGIDRLSRLHHDIAAGAIPEPEPGVRLVYVSPLKALSYDIERNLRAPLRGIGLDISVGLRTGDTPQSERNRMRREPPEILITTPESLYLMISSGARDILTGVETVIVDEIHAVAATKRGTHLALTLERLEHLAREGGPRLQRIGLSATQRPLERIAGFLSGPGRECKVVDPGQRKELDLEIVVPVEDMTAPEADHDGSHDDGSADDAPIRSIWPAIYPELLAQVRAHTSTIVFVNNRRAAERLAQRLNDLDQETGEVESPNRTATEGSEPNGAVPAKARETEALPLARAHHGSLSHEERTEVEEQLKSGLIPCLVATSSLELGIDMGAVDLVVQVESPKSVARGLQRIGRAGHGLGETSKGRIFPKFRGDLLESAVVTRRMREGLIEETVIPVNPLDVLAQHLVSMAALDKWDTDEAYELVRRTTPFAELSLEQFDNVLDMLDGRYPSDRFAELRPRLVWDRTGKTIEGRKGARSLVVTNAGTIPPRPLRGSPARRPPGRRARRGDGLRGAGGPGLPARRFELADPRDHPRPGDRDPRSWGSGRDPVLERRRDRPAGRAGGGDRCLRPRGRERRSGRARKVSRPRSAGGPQSDRLPQGPAGRDAGRAFRHDGGDRALP